MEIQGGIASSTHVDSQGQRIAKELLDEMSLRIRTEFIPLLVNHDFSQQIGVTLNARVIDLGDGEHALLVVTGIFDNDDEAAQFPSGAENSVWHDFNSVMDEVEGAAREEFEAVAQPAQDGQPEELSLAERLNLYLGTTEVMPDGTVYLVKRHFDSNSLGDLSIDVYADHDPPHFHVSSKQRSFDVRFYLDTLEIYSNKRGSIPGKDAKKIQDYFANNPDEHERLRKLYQSMHPGPSVGKT
jgi:hypothetical protein